MSGLSQEASNITICVNARDTLKGIIGKPREIVVEELQDSQEKLYRKISKRSLGEWAGAIVMRHGKVSIQKFPSGSLWAVTPITLASELIAAGADGPYLLSVERDMQLWFEHMREKNVSHCDMRPDNVVFFDDPPRWCIIDFGMARLHGEKLTVKWCRESSQSLNLPLSVVGDPEKIVVGETASLTYPNSADSAMLFNSCVSYARRQTSDESRGQGFLSKFITGSSIKTRGVKRKVCSFEVPR